MTYYIFIENEKINGAGQARILNETVTNFEVTEDICNAFVENPDKYIWNGSDVVVNPNYEQEQAEKVRNELIEQVNYPLKAQIAYTGVRFDYEGQELVFETNKDSMALISTTLVGILAGQTTLGEPVTTVDNWKCRKTVEPYEPVAVTFTVQQFTALVNFGRAMISQAFAIEEEINKQIQEMTTEQLNNPALVEKAKQQMELAYSKIPIKIENLSIS